jgi:hypothetical protein
MKENTYIKLKIYISIFGVVFRFAFSGVRVTRSLVLCVCVVDRCLFYCTLFCWPLYCLFFFDLRTLITLLVSSGSSFVPECWRGTTRLVYESIDHMTVLFTSDGCIYYVTWRLCVWFFRDDFHEKIGKSNGLSIIMFVCVFFVMISIQDWKIKQLNIHRTFIKMHKKTFS